MMLQSPTRSNVAARYLESIGDSASSTPNRLPLQPTLKYNQTSKESTDLDVLAKQLNVPTSPTKTAFLRTKFESPSATVSSFKTPRTKTSSNNSSRNSTPLKNSTNLNLEAKPNLSKNGDHSNLKHPTSFWKLRPDLKPDLFYSPGYEYLCRIQAIKNWLELVLQEEISQSPVELISYIRNGIFLAKLANVILPTKRRVFTEDSKLQFKHTENINRFFHLLDFMNVPDLFTFELTDLYDAKNVPKVWFCLHALSYLMNMSNSGYPKIENLVDKLDFSEDDIRSANRALVGAGLPNFASADNGNDSTSSDNTYMNRVAADSPIKVTTFSASKGSQSSFTKKQDSHPNPFEDTTKSSASLNSFHKELTKKSVPSTTKTPSTFKTPIASQSRISNFYTPELDSHIENIVKLQSLARGANFRYSMFVDKIMIKSYSDEFTYFFSIARGKLSRDKTIHRHRGELIPFKEEIVQLQSIVRRKLYSQGKPKMDGNTERIVKFQSKIRGLLERRRISTLKLQMIAQKDNVSELQAIMKMKKIHYRVSTVCQSRYQIEPSVLELQSICRRRLQERRAARHLIDEDSIVEFQSAIRSLRIRNHIRSIRSTITKQIEPLEELQSIARGGLARSRLCNSVLITLLYEDEVLNNLYAVFRGNKVRKEMAAKKSALQSVRKSSIIPLQSAFRGLYCRFEKDIKLDDVYCEVDSIIQLQAILRGARVRNDSRYMKEYYQKNINSVIKAQSLIKKTLVQNAYKTLLNKKNPPLSVIRRFAYLLSDSDLDYQDEMELSEAKDQIIDRSRSNEELENRIENLDIKLNLLDRNKITVEEFLKHKSKFKNNKVKDTKGGATTMKCLERLNKSSRERVELYQSMFYFLQTKPIYFVRLYKTMSVEKNGSKFNKDLQNFVMSLFPIKDSSVKHHCREEYYFVKLISELMKNDVENNSRSISDLTKTSTTFWIDYFLLFNNHTYQRQHLKHLVGKFVYSVIESDMLDFESDPSEIYEAIVEREHRVNGFSERPRGISPQHAIKEEDVSAKFVNNLMNLREVATEFLNTLELSADRVPLHVKVICKQAYELSQLQFPEKSDQQHLAVAGVVFIKHYIAPILQFPENFGFQNKDFYNPKARDNLKHLSRVMLQVFSMKPFSDSFLKPLNDYVTSSTEMTRRLIMNLISVKDLENEYELDDYNDIVSHERPKLTMNVSNMISLEKIISQHIDLIAPSSDDQLYRINTQLEEVVNSADDYVTLTELGSITLNLNPATKEDSIADSKNKSLFTQAKRCVLYIIRIQEGNGLLDLLISGIKPADEIKFREIVTAERKEMEQSSINARRKPYYKTSLGDLSKITYHDLKKMALEIILKLEVSAQLTRKNSFQELLNQIAIDIKTKDSQRVSRKTQLEIANKTLSKLKEKEIFLKKQLADYNKHVDTILSQLQSKPKDRMLFNIIPVFSKQYFYHRELKKNNRLPQFGSYKYSARKLVEQGIIIDFGGLLNRAHSSSSKLDFMFSCHKAGKFTIEAANGSVTIPGACYNITLDELLNYQYENKESFDAFDGMVMFNTNNLAAFIFRKFYDINRDSA
ncbi:ras GTPase-activating-like protein [Scheffersomyces stipitis CBS 6054]|uniref:Ras GTPase-activating-like protein n=1 Tax=Scheffersomyces stipitis (strain ATCC 58785 / CBS 6054 / NBRC 10063 / NRRL Y-11545) TaxID=322104 RepID=A3LY27_PICST|nr:ras GTPase-activating-like protein [Scheffersomyces stipitis CBS 6054]ABN67564.2 ras GTPase-activating-like protein [Scheffersomyces stipitis CBS 6054]